MNGGPEPQSTQEWQIRIWDKLVSIEGKVNALPCERQRERIDSLEHWKIKATIYIGIGVAIIAVVGNKLADKIPWP